MKEQNSKSYTIETKKQVPRFPLQSLTFALIVAFLVLSGVAAFVYASDVSDAGYRGTITMSNNGTANTSVSTVFTLNTQSLIDTNKLNSSANDCAIQTAAGTDVAFQPSVNSTYPWATWVPTIGEDATLYQYLFTSGVTGGKIRYFPGSGGMTTNDAADLEPADNFTTEQKGWVDMFLSANKNLVYKASAFNTRITGSSNISSVILGSSVWTTPSSHIDEGSWSNENNAYDDNTGSFADEGTAPNSWSNYLRLQLASPSFCDNVRFYAYYDANIISIDLDAYYFDGWQDVYEGSFADRAWVTKSLGDNLVSEVRVRFYNTDGAAHSARLYELDFGVTGGTYVTANGVTSGERTVRTWADTSYLHISIDGVESDNVSLSGVSVPDNANNWTYFENMGCYWEYTRTWVDGVLEQDIEWEYATTFSDQSGNSHDATPTFRTASSDPDVSANLTAFIGIMETTAPPAAGQTGWDIMTSVPDAPSGFFGEFDPSSMTFLGSGYVSTFSTATGIPLALIVFPYAFGIAIGAGFIAWYISSGGGKQHNRGSLLAMAATSLLVMLYFVYGAGGVIPGWILLPFAIEVLVFIVWRQTPSPF